MALTATEPPGSDQLPERARVHWRQRVSDESLARRERLWRLVTLAHTLPFVCTAVLLVALNLWMMPVALLALVFAWSIPDLYAARGAKVLRRGRRGDGQSEQVALGLLGDLLDHEPRELHRETALALERGRLGVWLLGEVGAVLVRPGAHRVHCYCVTVADPEIPGSDRIAHLLLALRTDEAGFATVANLAFAGARWRLRRRLSRTGREALDVAAGEAAHW